MKKRLANMTKTTSTVLILPILIMSMLILFSCKKDKKAEGTDKQLYDMAKGSSGFTWYKNSAALLDKSSGSGHNFPYLKTRYNAVASLQLDSIGKIKADAVFPDLGADDGTSGTTLLESLPGRYRAGAGAAGQLPGRRTGPRRLGRGQPPGRGRGARGGAGARAGQRVSREAGVERTESAR